MGLSKSSLYQTFGTKYVLFLNYVDTYQCTTSQERSNKFDASRSGKQFIEDFLQEVIEESFVDTEIKGCTEINRVNELFQQDQKDQIIIAPSG